MLQSLKAAENKSTPNFVYMLKKKKEVKSHALHQDIIIQWILQEAPVSIFLISIPADSEKGNPVRSTVLKPASILLQRSGHFRISPKENHIHQVPTFKSSTLLLATRICLKPQ